MLLALFSMLFVSSISCLIFYSRIARIMDRLKLLQKERRFEYKELFRFEADKKHPLLKQESEHYLKLLEQQTALVMKRANLIRKGLFCFIVSICSMTISLFCSLVNNPAWDVLVLGFFIFGLLLLFLGFIFALLELKLMLNPIQQESEFMQKLIRDEMLKNS